MWSKNHGKMGLKTVDKSRLVVDIFQQFLLTSWSMQEALGNVFWPKWELGNPGITVGWILDLEWESFSLDVIFPHYLEGVEARHINLKLEKPLLTRQWHINDCAVQVMESYIGWVRIFGNLREIRQTQIVISISKNVVSLCKSNKLECGGRHHIHYYNQDRGIFGNYNVEKQAKDLFY